MSSKGAVLARVGSRNVRLTHLDKVYWPDSNLTKRDLIDYYVTVSPVLLPHLRDRPLSLVRFPSGTDQKGFYQKDAPAGTPNWVRLAPIWSKERGENMNFILCDNVETLVWMANSGVVEINPWLSRYDEPELPDFAVFDIDPSEGTTWEDVKSVARMVRSLLESWKLVGFPKVSGATGIHIYVPILRKHSYRDVSAFVRMGATAIRDAYPEKVTLERKVKDRTGKVYIDYPQNARGQTISSVYGVKATPGAPVSMPIRWDELDRVNSKYWDMKTAPARIQAMGDLFSGTLTTRQDISPFVASATSG